MPALHERDARAYIERRYNTRVPAARPQPQPDKPSPGQPAKRDIYTLEAGGILIIGLLVLILTLVRYWHYISWGAR